MEAPREKVLQKNVSCACGELATYYLHAGTLYVPRVPTMISTVLGSCVSVCLWDKEKKMGGMNHFQLALWNGSGLASPKFGNIAVKRLIEKMLEQGCSLARIRAKVFGGASVIQKQPSSLKVGENNISIAKDILREYNISIVAGDTGGSVGRKIRFHTGSGTVYMNRLKKNK